MTKISKDWHHFKPTSTDIGTCDSCWDMFVLLTRKIFSPNSKDLMIKTNSAKRLRSKLPRQTSRPLMM